MRIEQGVDGVRFEMAHKRFRMRVWDPVDGEIPDCPGGWAGVDTETLRISDIEPYIPPDLVLLQAAYPGLVHLVPWDQAADYVRRVAVRGIKMAMFNAAFDVAVLRPFLPEVDTLVESGLIVDVRCRKWVRDISLKGFMNEHETLASAFKASLAVELEKPEDVRLSYTRDMELDMPHAVYAAKDAVATLLLAECVPSQKTEEDQTMGSVALDSIERRGMLVDRDYFNVKKSELAVKMLEDAEEMRLMGFDPDPKATAPAALLKKAALDVGLRLEMGPELKTPGTMYRQLSVMWLARLASGDPANLTEDLRNILAECLRSAPNIAIMELRRLADSIGMPDLVDVRRIGLHALLLSLSAAELKKGSPPEDAFEVVAALRRLRGGFDDVVAVKPKEFLQNHLRKLLGDKENSWPKTPTNQLSTSKDHLANFKDYGIEKDPLLDMYAEYKHSEKLIGTYFNERHVRKDGRMHPRYRVMVLTGRTSCADPNLFYINELRCVA
jgi:hypothetical protein